MLKLKQEIPTPQTQTILPACLIVMFSDETTILGLLDTHTDISGYTLEVKKSAKLCDSQHLIANTKKAE